MAKLYTPTPVEHRVWTVDRVGDLIAGIVIFSLIFAVGYASCFEVMA